MIVGWNDEPGVWLRNAQTAKNTGATCARIVVGWNAGSPGDEASRAVERVRALGLKPIICVWVASPKPTKEEYRVGFDRITRTFGAGPWYELINEPNHEWFGNFTPAEAADYSIAASFTAKWRDSRIKVIGPAVAPVGNYASYMAQMYGAIPLGLVDAIGIHSYPQRGDNGMGDFRADFNLAANFGRVAVTEVGFGAHAFGVPRAAQHAAEAYTWTKAQPAAHSLVYHRLGGPDDAGHWNLVDPPLAGGAPGQTHSHELLRSSIRGAIKQ